VAIVALLGVSAAIPALAPPRSTSATSLPRFSAVDLQGPATVPALGPAVPGPSASPTYLVSSVGVGSGPIAAVYDAGDGNVYVPNENSASVSVIGGTTAIGSARLGPLRGALVVGGIQALPQTAVDDTRSGLIYVPNAESDNLSVLIGTDLIASLPLGGGIGSDPEGGAVAAYDDWNGYVYVANAVTGNVSVVADTALLTNISVGGSPQTVTYDPSDGFVYVTNGFPQGVDVIDGTALVGTLNLSAVPNSAAYDGANGYVYVPADVGGPGNGYVSVIQGSTSLASVTVGNDPAFAACDSANGDVYVTNSGSGTVSVLNGTSLVATIRVGSGPDHVTYDPGNGLVYVSNFGGSNVSVISGSTVVGIVPVGNSPEGATVDPVTDRLYVPNFGSGSVSVFSGGYPVVFSERGLPNGTRWSVTFDGRSASGTGPLTFPGTLNGSHRFAVGPLAGYNATPANGSLTVQGPGSSLSILFQALPPAPGHGAPSTLFGIPTWTSYGLIAGIVAAFALGVVLGIVWKRRRAAPKRPARPSS